MMTEPAGERASTSPLEERDQRFLASHLPRQVSKDLGCRGKGCSYCLAVALQVQDHVLV